ncbi:MAG TPA: cytochrome c oxidase assembly factor 1 family protein [Terriglobales bacterium]|nr:cytochrome c oxidase assembly factor 1 family protein [Terriglobales bacterium]
MSATATPVPPQPQGWFARHWKAVVGVGCLGVIILAVAFVGGIMLLVMGSIRSSDAYQQALAKAKANPEVVLRLGQPIQPGWFISGSINVSGAAGDADLSIPISGPKGKGTVYVVGKKSAGEWSYTRMEVEVEGQPGRIDLLAPNLQ